jgi:hypothetical protein
VPVISRFLGIAMSILYDDHDPPHFHATYGSHRISVGIRDGTVRGRFPRRAQAHVLEWLVSTALIRCQRPLISRGRNSSASE